MHHHADVIVLFAQLQATDPQQRRLKHGKRPYGRFRQPAFGGVAALRRQVDEFQTQRGRRFHLRPRFAVLREKGGAQRVKALQRQLPHLFQHRQVERPLPRRVVGHIVDRAIRLALLDQP